MDDAIKFLISILKEHSENQMKGAFDSYTRQVKKLTSDFDYFESNIMSLIEMKTATILQRFLDAWIDEINHGFANYNGLSKEQFPEIALKIVSELEKYGMIHEVEIETIIFKGNR